MINEFWMHFQDWFISTYIAIVESERTKWGVPEYVANFSGFSLPFKMRHNWLHWGTRWLNFFPVIDEVTTFETV